MKYYNLARMYTTTTGDSDVTLGEAVPGCKTFALAGVSDSEEVGYGLITYSLTTRRAVGSETGIGKYISSGPVFKRTTVHSSTDSDDSAIDLTGLTEIYITPPASQFNIAFIPFARYGATGDVTLADAASGIIPIDSATIDDYSLVTLTDSDEKLTIREAGWYEISASVGHFSNGAAYSGRVLVGYEVTGAIDARAESRTYPAADSISTDDFLIHIPLTHVTADNTSFIQLPVTNFTGQSTTFYLNYVSIKRLKED